MSATKTTTTETNATRIHVQVWTGSLCARITEMANAGRRGKTCRVLRVSTSGCVQSMPGYGEVLHCLRETLPGLTGEESLDDVALLLRALRGVCSGVAIYEETIRGVDAPRPVLSASVAGQWSASADETGVCISNLTDRFNEPRSITPSDQTGPRAYELASRVWVRVQTAKTYSEVLEILGAAGVRLHSFCAVD